MNPERKKLSQLTEFEKARLYADLFSSETGRLVLEDLRLRCFVYEPSFNENSANQPYTAIANEGKRSVILTIETMISAPKEEESDSAGSSHITGLD